MKINKQLLEELILEVLEEEETELDEGTWDQMKKAFGGFGQKKSASAPGRARSAGPGIGDAAAAKLSNSAALRSLFRLPMVQKALSQVKTCLLYTSDAADE